MSENVIAGKHKGHHSKCHVHTYEDAVVVDVYCRLEQNEEECGFLLCDVDAKFYVDVIVTGSLAKHLCFDLCAALHIECYGRDDPRALTPITKEFDCSYVGKPITFEFDVPANTLCDPVPEEPGDADCGLLCCFAATVTSRTKCGEPGHISCVCKGPCVGIHKNPA